MWTPEMTSWKAAKARERARRALEEAQEAAEKAEELSYRFPSVESNGATPSKEEA